MFARVAPNVPRQANNPAQNAERGSEEIFLGDGLGAVLGHGSRAWDSGTQVCPNDAVLS